MAEAAIGVLRSLSCGVANRAAIGRDASALETLYGLLSPSRPPRLRAAAAATLGNVVAGSAQNKRAVREARFGESHAGKKGPFNPDPKGAVASPQVGSTRERPIPSPILARLAVLVDRRETGADEAEAPPPSDRRARGTSCAGARRTSVRPPRSASLRPSSARLPTRARLTACVRPRRASFGRSPASQRTATPWRRPARRGPSWRS